MSKGNEPVLVSELDAVLDVIGLKLSPIRSTERIDVYWLEFWEHKYSFVSLLGDVKTQTPDTWPE